MTKHRVDDIRDVALVGHEQAGKTSLADALLFKAKAVERRGSVEDGTSVSDFDDEEKRVKYSIDSTVLHLEHKGKQVYLLDSPGKPEFVGAALGALNAVDNAVIVINATAGIQVNTRRMFQEAGKRGLARLFVINRLDGDNIHFTELYKSLQATFGKGCALYNAPVGVGAAFTGVVDMLNAPGTTPAGCPVDVVAARSQLVDAIVESDEALMEKFLLEGSVTNEELAAALPKALAAGTVLPIFCTSAKKDIGVAELLDALCNVAESPVLAKRRTAVGHGGEEVPVEPLESRELVAQVFKTNNDKFVGNLSFLRVYSGKIDVEHPFLNLRNHKSSKTAALLLMQGKGQKTVTEAGPGDIVAVAKIEDLHIGDQLSTHQSAPKLPKPVYPLPMFGLAVEPKARGDEQKISTSLHKIADEDQTFKVSRDPQTKEMVITGMSQLHLDTIHHRLKRRYDLEILTHEPKIPYRETITGHAEASHRHKKQSGGRGQFGEVHLRVYQLPREITSKEQLEAEFANKSRFEKIRIDHTHYDPEHNFAFIDTIVGGSIPNQFVPAIEKGCKELLERGALAGFRIQDVAVEVYFGKSHDVDSSEAAFKTAGRIAFKNGFLAAHPVLLEPIVNLEVTIPSRFTGGILSDLNTKRCRVENQDQLPGDLAVISAKGPLAELTRYKMALDSITQGQGAYAIEFSHYDVVPGNVQTTIVKSAKVAHHEEDE